MIDLVRRGKEGDVDAVYEIICKFRPLVISSIKRYCNFPREFEDLISDLNILIIHCIETFDESRGVYFEVYLRDNIRFYLLKTAKFLKDSNLSLNVTLGEDEEEFINLIPDDFNLEEDFFKGIDNLELYSMLLRLSKRTQEVLFLYFFHNLSVAEIAGFLGISARTVSNLKLRGIYSLRRFYGFK